MSSIASSVQPVTATGTTADTKFSAPLKDASVAPAKAAPSASTTSASVSLSSPPSSSVPLAAVSVRKSSDRGHASHGWLNSYHTFSFASFYDARFMNFHSLRVINEDRVSPSEGFGTHPHSNAEIFSYVVSGALSHRDSMGNKEIIKRGDVQFTSAGSGISHSEYNGSDKETVHFIQIWVKPSVQNIKPSYQTKSFDEKQKAERLCLIVSPDGEAGSVSIHQDIRVYATILKPNQSVAHNLAPGREAYVHVIQDATSMDTEANLTGLDLNGTKLGGGDGAFVRHAKDTASGSRLVLTGAGKSDAPAEVLLFDVAKL